MYFNLGNGDNSLGGSSLLGLLSSSKLDLSSDAVEVTTTLAGQSPSTVGILLCQLQTLKCLKLKTDPLAQGSRVIKRSSI